jgi:5-methylcytosine-specific restriction endonuclease McrBC GTP-binding regulatory subunit McrB
MRQIVLAMMTGALLFGTATASFADEKEGKIQRRKERQQKRIANGVKNGTLQPGKTAKIERQEAKLNKEIRSDRKENGGNLTNKEKKQINQQQNKLSKEIYKDKHNETKPAQP